MVSEVREVYLLGKPAAGGRLWALQRVVLNMSTETWSTETQSKRAAQMLTTAIFAVVSGSAG